MRKEDDQKRLPRQTFDVSTKGLCVLEARVGGIQHLNIQHHKSHIHAGSNNEAGHDASNPRHVLLHGRKTFPCEGRALRKILQTAQRDIFACAGVLASAFKASSGYCRVREPNLTGYQTTAIIVYSILGVLEFQKDLVADVYSTSTGGYPGLSKQSAFCFSPP